MLHLTKKVNIFEDIVPNKKVFNICIFLFVFLLSLLVIYDAQSPRFIDGQKMMQAVFYSYTFLLAMLIVLARRARINKFLFIGTLLSSLGLIKSVTSNHYHLNWILGDFLLMTSPIMIAIAVYYRPHLFINRVFWWIVLAAFTASLIAFLFPDISDRNRFEAPSILIITTISYFLITGDFKRYRLISICVYFLIVALAWFSQWRFNFMLTLLCPIFIMTIQYGLKKLIIYIPLLLLVVGFVIFLNQDLIISIIEQSRFSNIFIGGISSDGSLMFRFFEAAAVLQYCIDNWNIFDYVFGGGHGAWFDGGALSSLAQTKYLDDKIFNGQIRVHNIHIGFIAIFYRYGLVGIIILVYLLKKIWNYLLKIREFPIEIRILTTSTFIYFLTQLTLYNMANTVLFTFVVGSFFGAYLLTGARLKY